MAMSTRPHACAFRWIASWSKGRVHARHREHNSPVGRCFNWLEWLQSVRKNAINAAFSSGARERPKGCPGMGRSRTPYGQSESGYGGGALFGGAVANGELNAAVVLLDPIQEERSGLRRSSFSCASSYMRCRA